jgi:hypothetical protein
MALVTVLLALSFVSSAAAKARPKGQAGTKLKILDHQLEQTWRGVLISLEGFQLMVEKLSQERMGTACNMMVVVDYRRPLEDIEQGAAKGVAILKKATAHFRKGESAPRRLAQAVKNGALGRMQEALQKTRILLVLLSEAEASCNNPL